MSGCCLIGQKIAPPAGELVAHDLAQLVDRRDLVAACAPCQRHFPLLIKSPTLLFQIIEKPVRHRLCPSVKIAKGSYDSVILEDRANLGGLERHRSKVLDGKSDRLLIGTHVPRALSYSWSLR